MLIAQISDTHIAGWGKKAYGIAPTAENLANCVNDINQLIPKPDLVLVTGDISNTGFEEELEQAATLLNKLDIPYYVIPGNHDDRPALKSVFDKQSCPTDSAEFINYVIDEFEVRLIAMDSTHQGESGGQLCDARLAWLEEQLAEDKQKPTIIFMHHPPVKVGVIEADIDGFVGADKLACIIKNYSNIERIICGHIHLQTHTRWHGTVVTTAPSVGMELVLDLTMKKPSQFVLEPPSYLLHYWTPDQFLVTHTVSVSIKEGPYPFEGHNHCLK
jgi:3',5'-cyclic AMP phosphodiesterase CpdA